MINFIKVLLENDYPLGLIFNTIVSRIKSLINEKTIQQNNSNENESNNRFTILY